MRKIIPGLLLVFVLASTSSALAANIAVKPITKTAPLPAPTPVVTVTTKPVPTPTIISTNTTVVPSDNQMIKDQLTQVNNSIDNLSVKVITLDTANKNLQTQVAALQQRMLQVEQTIMQMQQTQQGSWYAKSMHWLQAQFGIAGSYIVIIAIALVGILVIFFIFSLFKTSSSRPVAKIEPAIGTHKDDFDLMNASEGIAAKLNLARAYVDMGNPVAAQELLETVVDQGNPEQQAEAKKMLDKLQSE